MSNTPPWLGTVREACKLVGGDRPIDKSSYYRGAKLGYYEPPVKIGPNTSRVDLGKLSARIRARLDGGESGA